MLKKRKAKLNKVVKLAINEYEGIERLVVELCNFGYQDLRATNRLLKEYQIQTDDFVSYVHEWMDDTGTNILTNEIPIDVCSLAYEYVLGKVRDKIQKITKFDLMNDAEFYVQTNYCCSCFDYTEEDKYKLTEAICCSEKEDRQELLDNHIIKTFLEYVELDKQIKLCHKSNGGD